MFKLLACGRGHLWMLVKAQAAFQRAVLMIKHGLHGQCWWSDAGAVIRV